MSDIEKEEKETLMGEPLTKKIKTEIPDELISDFKTEPELQIKDEIKEEIENQESAEENESSDMDDLHEEDDDSDDEEDEVSDDEEDEDSDDTKGVTDDFFAKLMEDIRPKKYSVTGTTLAVTDAHVIQFKVSLLRGKHAPQIWRRFIVPANYNFRQLHIAIQKSMGWKSVDFDYHLHEFHVVNPKSGFKDSIVLTEDLELQAVDNGKDENTTYIKDYFYIKNHKGRYNYDFGMDWLHEIIVESSHLAEKGKSYPVCIAGANACPPEDGVAESSEEVESGEEYDSD